MPFQKGQSGNPSGRPLGARNRATLIAETLLQGEAEALTRSTIERAKAGDTAALRMCLDRLAPPCRHRTIAFELPPLRCARDATVALAAITAAVGAGELTPAEAGELFKLVDGFTRILEATIFEHRLTQLERNTGTMASNSSWSNPISQDHHGGQSAQSAQSTPATQSDPKSLYDFGDAP
jgi:hypothetical protein